MSSVDASGDDVSPPHVDVDVRPDLYAEDFMKVIEIIRPSWKIEDVVFKESPKGLAQGLMNTMVRCYSNQDLSDVIMVRIVNPVASQLSDRGSEIKCIKYLHARDCAPKMLATFRTGYCYQFIHGEVLTHLRLREESIWRSVAEELAKIHAAELVDEGGLKKQPKFIDMFQMIRQGFPEMMKTPEKTKRLKEELPDKETLNKEADEAIAHALTFDPDLVLTHNDTRAENIIWNKDTGSAKFVDFEAVAYNYRPMELAGHFHRYGGMDPIDFSLIPDEEFQLRWLRVYLEKHFEETGRERSDVTDLEVRKLYVQVLKFHLVLCIIAGLAGPAIENMGLVPENSVDLLGFAIEAVKEYYQKKEEIFALEMPQ